MEGNLEEMESAIELAREKSKSTYHQYYLQAVVEMHIAIAHMAMGEMAKAIDVLEAASQLNSYIFVDREIKLWFVFDPLRGDPRLNALVEG